MNREVQNAHPRSKHQADWAFLFDLGTGSMANVAALMIPYQYLDKVFLSHLHTDHFGDIDALWAGGWTAGRPNALRVWGPSGATPEMSTNAVPAAGRIDLWALEMTG